MKKNANCTPFLGHRKWGVLVLGGDKRVRYPAETKLRAVEMIRAGYGRDAIAAELGATGSAVREWQKSCWTAGHGRSFAMGTDKGSYAFELKLCFVKRI